MTHKEVLAVVLAATVAALVEFMILRKFDVR